jgi:hypothetical protein
MSYDRYFLVLKRNLWIQSFYKYELSFVESTLLMAEDAVDKN